MGNYSGQRNSADDTALMERKTQRLVMALSPVSAQRRVARIIDEFGSEAAITTSFGPTSAVLLHMVSAIYPGIRVIHVNHGHETEGTVRFAQLCQERLQINLRVYEAPRVSIPAWGTPEFAEFCRIVKVEPMQQALEKEHVKVWFAGLIHDETVERRHMSLVRVRLGRIAVYPILDWCLQDMLIYCKANDLPLNDDYFDPCKGPEQKLECGLHFVTDHSAADIGRK
jgi:phosphoadenosine phosphosulfate reductase